MKKIIFLHRAAGYEYSIENIFDSIQHRVEKKYQVERICLPNINADIRSLVKNLFYARRNCNSITHVVGCVHYALLLIRKKCILTIHDNRLITEEKGIRKYLFLLLWYYLPMKKAKYVTCISPKVEDELKSIFPSFKNKIRLIPNPVNPIYSLKLKDFNKEKPRILFIGIAENKNLERCILALQSIPSHLRVVGKRDNAVEKMLHSSNIDFSYVHDLTNRELLKEYEQCDILLFPSLFEGFGMPIIEAQSVGRAVITSNIEPMRWVANGSACLADPYDYNDIKDSILHVINDDNYRLSLIEKGINNVKRFDIDRITDQYLEIYESL